MSYMALYRKWRPSEFQDVKGQDHIVTTLKNQITAERIGHAYLFCGTRGTGKTTIAKLFAKAVNCEHPVDGNPCNECTSCRAINEQRSMNVIEIDAASNNGVDNIREIRDEVQYSPTEGKYKVYIIDEVHMLSIGAFNALLKTLEEPPPYVIFILATTEAHKIPITILSRCQRYDFKRISIDTITDRLRDLMDKEAVEVEEKALRYIAKAADGSMRDALSLLDQCIAFYLGKKLTYENVLEVLGAVDTTVFGQLFDQILMQNSIGVMKVIEDMIINGRELLQFVTDFIWYLRNLLLLKNSDGEEDALDMSAENLAVLKEAASRIDDETLMRYIRVLSELSNQVKYATQKRVIVEVALIKLCKPQMESNLDSILDRLRILEDKMEHGVVSIAESQSAKQETVSTIPAKIEYDVDGELSKRFEPADADFLKQLLSNWNVILKAVTGPAKSFLPKAKITIGATAATLNLVFQDEMAKEYFERDDYKNLHELEQIVINRTGKEIKLNCLSGSSMADSGFENYNLSILSKLNIPIEYEND